MSESDIDEIVRKGELAYLQKQKKKLEKPASSLCNKALQTDQDIIKKAYEEALFLVYKQKFAQQLRRDFDEGEIKESGNSEHDAILLKAWKATSTKPPYMFVTINPKPGVNLKDLKKCVAKYISKSTIPQYAYVYEVRDNNGGGLHCHILLEYTCKPFDFQRSTKSTFKNVCDVDNPHVLNFRYITVTELSAKLDYMEGKKQDKKLAAVNWTVDWRKANNIDPIYKSIPFSLLGYVETPLFPPELDDEKEGLE